MYNSSSSKTLATTDTALSHNCLMISIINKQVNNVNIHHTFSSSRQRGDHFHDAVENVPSRKLPVTKTRMVWQKQTYDDKKLEFIRNNCDVSL